MASKLTDIAMRNAKSRTLARGEQCAQLHAARDLFALGRVRPAASGITVLGSTSVKRSVHVCIRPRADLAHEGER